MNKGIKTILILILVAILLVGAYVMYRSLEKRNVETSNKGYTISDITSGELSNTEVPDLDRMVVNDKTLSAEVVGILKIKIADLSDFLKGDPGQFDKWLDLGINRKIAGDYEGAIEAWTYASALRPQNSISFNNLGDLYAYYLNEPQKAEENLLQAIENGSNEVYLYFKTHDFYKYVMKDATKARNIVEQGIKANPTSQELKDLLNSL